MEQINGSTTGGSPVHSDFPSKITKTSQENGRVSSKVTSHNVGDSSKGMEGSINNKGIGGRGSPFKR